MRRILLAIVFIAGFTGFVAYFMTLSQINTERQRIMSDIELRSNLFVEGIREPIAQRLQTNLPLLSSYVNNTVESGKVMGIVIFNAKSSIVTASSIAEFPPLDDESLVKDAIKGSSSEVLYKKTPEGAFFYHLTPLYKDNVVLGVLMTIQDAGYIDSRLHNIWLSSMTRSFLQIFIVTFSFTILFYLLFFRPINELTRVLKSDDDSGGTGLKRRPNIFFLQPLIDEFFQMRRSMVEARLSAGEEARLRLNRLDTVWTENRLSEFVKKITNGRSIYLVSNREPYVNTKVNDKIVYSRPASGLVTAIEPVMKATGGTWIAYGSGSADAQVVDKNDIVRVPPSDPRYDLSRVWLSKDEVEKYYEGFSNAAFWPLCHNVHVRPVFREKDWEMYKLVNEKFADRVLREIKGKKRPVILIQDYHFALLPEMIKKHRPDAVIGLFWHIPWPSFESFSICPWKEELLEGMLGADLIGFHVQYFCNNFIATVNKSLEALTNWEQYTLSSNQHITQVKPFPISIDFTGLGEVAPKESMESTERKEVLESYGVFTKQVALGIDRLDYTKGLIERLKAIDILLDNNPALKKNFTFIQCAAPSRTNVDAYREYGVQVQEEVDRINQKHQTRAWRPVVYVKRFLGKDKIDKLYKACDVCVVTPLHDGMNLVAKEFIAARSDQQGVLVLSKFTGAARELTGAIIVNPYDANKTADAIKEALTMPPARQRKRMKKMREAVKDYNVYRWSAEYIKALMNMS